ncbi:MAG: hypothetical protein EXR80_05410 [Methylococcales bacterium]|nr:hypothetical protein [Methylococcales bacterium]
MQAYYEIETNIPSNHQLQIQLPDSIPVGRAKIAIIYEFTETKSNAGSALNTFLNTYQTENTKDLITAIKKFRVKKPLSNQDIKALCEEGRA